MKKFLILIIIFSLASPSYAFFWNKKDKTIKDEYKGKGYAGTLPNIDNKLKKNQRPKAVTPIFETQESFDNPAELKPIPKDNPAFINIIQKKEDISQFAVDTNEIIPMLEKLVDCIENNESVQLFVTKANLLTMNIDFLADKYANQPESYFQSFDKLQEVGNFVKSISTLRKEAQTYQRYLAYSSTGSIYNPENIEQQLEYLKEELNNTILLLREEI